MNLSLCNLRGWVTSYKFHLWNSFLCEGVLTSLGHLKGIVAVDVFLYMFLSYLNLSTLTSSEATFIPGDPLEFAPQLTLHEVSAAMSSRGQRGLNTWRGTKLEAGTSRAVGTALQGLWHRSEQSKAKTTGSGRGFQWKKKKFPQCVLFHTYMIWGQLVAP